MTTNPISKILNSQIKLKDILTIFFPSTVALYYYDITQKLTKNLAHLEKNLSSLQTENAKQRQVLDSLNKEILNLKRSIEERDLIVDEFLQNSSSSATNTGQIQAASDQASQSVTGFSIPEVMWVPIGVALCVGAGYALWHVAGTVTFKSSATALVKMCLPERTFKFLSDNVSYFAEIKEVTMYDKTSNIQWRGTARGNDLTSLQCKPFENVEFVDANQFVRNLFDYFTKTSNSTIGNADPTSHNNVVSQMSDIIMPTIDIPESVGSEIVTEIEPTITSSLQSVAGSLPGSVIQSVSESVSQSAAQQTTDIVAYTQAASVDHIQVVETLNTLSSAIF